MKQQETKPFLDSFLLTPPKKPNNKHADKNVLHMRKFENKMPSTTEFDAKIDAKFLKACPLGMLKGVARNIDRFRVR
jgi:hypothetical protein